MIEASRISGRSQRFIHASKEMGLWSLEPLRYVLWRHDLSDGGIDARVGREVEWFPGTGDGNPAGIFDFAVDDRGLLWVLLSVQAPDAPAALWPRATDEDERIAIANRYRNVMIEVLTVDGRLLASRTFEDLRGIPRPITAGRWYREETDLLRSIVILEPRLVER